MDPKKKLAMLEDTLELEEGALKPGMLLDDIEEYDSMAKLALIVLMKDEFDKQSNQIFCDSPRYFGLYRVIPTRMSSVR